MILSLPKRSKRNGFISLTETAKTTVELSVGLLYYLYALDYLVTYKGYTIELT